MDAQGGQMNSYQLAVSLANHLRSLTVLDSAGLQDTIDQIQMMLPLDIRIYQEGRDICISLREAPVDDRMSLQNILYHSENEAPPLRTPSTTPAYDSDSDVYLLNEVNGVGFDWDAWIDERFL